MYFPSQYKNALRLKKKNSTIRIRDEVGKYRVGKTYSVKSYAGSDWGIKILIINIIPTSLKGLPKFGVPKRSVEAIHKFKKISVNEIVELIRFQVL